MAAQLQTTANRCYHGRFSRFPAMGFRFARTLLAAKSDI